MVAQLMKHEIRRTWKPLLLALGVPSLVALLAAGFVGLDLGYVSDGALILGMLAVALAITLVQVFLVYDYWRSSHSAAAHLIHSVPVRGGRIYWVKLGWGALAMLAASIWCVVLWFVMFAQSLTGSFSQAFDEVLSATRQVLAMLPGWLILAIVAFFLLATVLSLAQYHFAIAVGSESWINRLGAAGPVLVYLATMVVLQVLTAVSLLVLPFGVGAATPGGPVGLHTVSVADLAAGSEVVPVGFVLVLALATVVMVWRTVVSWNSRISLR